MHFVPQLISCSLELFICILVIGLPGCKIPPPFSHPHPSPLRTQSYQRFSHGVGQNRPAVSYASPALGILPFDFLLFWFAQLHSPPPPSPCRCDLQGSENGSRRSRYLKEFYLLLAQYCGTPRLPSSDSARDICISKTSVWHLFPQALRESKKESNK